MKMILKVMLIALFAGLPLYSHAETDCDVDVGCSDEPVEVTPVVPQLAYTEFLKLYGSDEMFVLVDVRPKANYDYEHIKGAVNLFVSQAAPEEIAQVLPDKNAKIIVYCSGHTCSMSYHAAKRLVRLGYTNVFNYEGGIGEWRSYQQPIDRTAPAVATNP